VTLNSLYTVAGEPIPSGELSVPDPSPAQALRAIADNVLLPDIWVVEKDGTRRRQTPEEEARHREFIASKVGSGCAPGAVSQLIRPPGPPNPPKPARPYEVA
jgi:hypothetical protein